MSISWGKEKRVQFHGAWKLGEWTPPQTSGVYAITYKEDRINKPKSHTLVYFGEGENIAELGLPWGHACSDWWVGIAGAGSELYIFFHPMPQSTQLERWQLHDRLVSEYKPLCNRL